MSFGNGGIVPKIIFAIQNLLIQQNGLNEKKENKNSLVMKIQKMVPYGKKIMQGMAAENGNVGKIEKTGKKVKGVKDHMMKTETELQIEEEMKPPILKSVYPPDIIDSLLNTEGDFMDILIDLGYVKYNLDQFPNALAENDPKLKLLDCGYFRLKQEEKYLTYLIRLFLDNKESAHIFALGIDFNDLETCINKIERLDKIDEYIVLSLHKYFREANTYIIEDEILLRFFQKGFLREAISGIIYFDKLDIFVMYGYDMTLPVFIKSDKTFEKYSKIAIEHGLHIRSS